jgi:nucleotide-binding universal stress UspA family protein
MQAEIRRILCPVDFSGCSQHALGYALKLAVLCNGDLELLHVMTMPISALPDFPSFPDLSPETVRAIEESARRKIEELATSMRREYPRVATTLASGQPFLEIILAARERSADLIVMGTHGRTGLPHMLMGSVAEKVVRKASCPVLTVKHPEHRFVMP